MNLEKQLINQCVKDQNEPVNNRMFLILSPQVEPCRRQKIPRGSTGMSEMAIPKIREDRNDPIARYCIFRGKQSTGSKSSAAIFHKL